MMKPYRIALVAMFVVAANSSLAATSGTSAATPAASTATAPSAKAEYTAAKKAATVRYEEDRKLCADEKTSSIRMQCLRDAKTEYSAALKTASEDYAKAKSTKTGAASTSAVSAKSKAPACPECGKVSAVRIEEKKGESTPLGMIAGGVAGAVLGHQVGGGRGKDVATIAGAAGGAYAGHKIEEHVRSTKAWIVSVHFNDGSDKEFSFEADPGYAAGDAVKTSGNSIVRQ